MRKIIFFDTTLRDGEQSPGISLNRQEKLEIAKQLKRLGVDVIEAGFPIASPGDYDAVACIAREVQGPIIAALARATEKDIECAAEALKDAGRPRIHTFIATSPIHMKYKLRKSPEEVLEMTDRAVRLASSLVPDVEFSAEDATRSDLGFLCEVYGVAIAAGATTINVPDTVGYSTPSEFHKLIRHLREHVPGIEKAVISVHCHNDLGLAVANTLSAVDAGAVQLECAVNGLGERAGNAALEELVMALHTRADIFQVETSIVTEHLYRTSRLVSNLSGVAVQPNKAIVGENAFAHESGIHQDGVLKERTTYEIMTPQSIGLQTSRLVLGKHSGRHAFKQRLAELGYEMDPEEAEKAYARFIDLCDRKKGVDDRDIQALVDEQMFAVVETYRLEYLQVTSGNTTVSTATVRIRHADDYKQEAACGEGPVEAVYRAIDRATGVETDLISYSLGAVTGGKDALGEVTVQVRDNGLTFVGRGTSTDIIEASARAYLQAINKMVQSRQRTT
ncbi:MAG: 2-isopropylmalate synthase [Limnochordia bacterium]|jgi:2-isopropylmalate synthase